MSTLCSSVVLENILPPPPMEGHGNSKGRGDPKGGNFRGEGRGGGWGVAYRLFFPGDLSKIGESLINNSFSVEQAFSYFTVTGVSKQVLLFALIIFYLRSAKCFFFLTAYPIVFFNTVITKLLVIY